MYTVLPFNQDDDYFEQIDPLMYNTIEDARKSAQAVAKEYDDNNVKIGIFKLVEKV